MIKNIKDAKIGFGTYRMLDENDINTSIMEACKNGYDFIDTAYFYGNEELIGNALKKVKEQNINIPLIQTKIWVTQYKKDIVSEVKESLKRLGVNCLDCCLLHRPHVDMTINVRAWKGLIECVKLGLIKEIGVSNFDRDLIEVLYNETNVYPCCNQIECSAMSYRPDRMAYAKSRGISIQGWRPMGLPNKTLENELLKKLSKKYNCTIAQLLISFTNKSGAIPIIKSTNKDRIISNKKGIDISISQEDWDLMEKELNTFMSTTDLQNDSFATLYLDKD